MAAAPRVVSLVPSATETLVALGADLVACTRFCKQPAIPAVGGTKNPDVAAIVVLHPDVVVVDTEENRREDADALAGHGITVVATEVRSVSATADAVATLARVAGVEPPAPAGLDEALPAVTAFVPIWRRPWMTINADTYGASLLRTLGIGLVTDAVGERYPNVELAEIAELRPDLILVPSEPYAFDDRHVAELAAAIPAATVLPVDGEDLFWWGIRTPDAHARLGAVLAPVIGDGVSRGSAPR